jgi:hypothetical protein
LEKTPVKTVDQGKAAGRDQSGLAAQAGQTRQAGLAARGPNGNDPAMKTSAGNGTGGTGSKPGGPDSAGKPRN